jgi:hypothetical protein
VLVANEEFAEREAFVANAEMPAERLVITVTVEIRVTKAPKTQVIEETAAVCLTVTVNHDAGAQELVAEAVVASQQWLQHMSAVEGQHLVQVPNRLPKPENEVAIAATSVKVAPTGMRSLCPPQPLWLWPQTRPGRSSSLRRSLVGGRAV